MKKLQLFKLSILLAALLLIQTAQAADYFVSISGKDTNDGLSEATAWATISKAFSTVPANQGHVINIGAGTFEVDQANPPSGVTIKGAGVTKTIIHTVAICGIHAKNRSDIIFRDFTADASGQKWWFPGPNPVDQIAPYVMRVEDCKNIQILNVNITNGSGWGLDLGQVENVLVDTGYHKEAAGRGTTGGDRASFMPYNITNGIFRNLRIEDTDGVATGAWASMINVKVYNVIAHGAKTSAWNDGASGNMGMEWWAVTNVEDCEIYQCDLGGSMSMVQDGKAKATKSMRFHHNVVTGNYGVEMSMDNLTVDHNFFHDCGYPFANFGASTDVHENVNIHHNVCYNTGNSIFLHYSTALENAKVYNNTVYNTKSDASAGFNYFGGKVSNIEFKNNIFWSSKGASVNFYNQLATNNLFFITKGSGLNQVVGNPLFVNANSSDVKGFVLQEASPAINAGIAISGSPDTIGKPDIGAFEYGIKPWDVGPQNMPEMELATYYHPVPGKILPYNWIEMKGVRTEVTKSGNMWNEEVVSYIDAGDYLVYAINTMGDDNYTLTINSAGASAGSIKILDESGTPIDTILVGSTGSLLTYKTSSSILKLKKGEQKLKFVVIKGGFNLSWINFSSANFNSNPSISITSPSSGSTYREPASLLIQATAEDYDGSIDSVEFFVDNVLVANDKTVPYSYQWTNIPIGSVVITAKAYDNKGAVTASSPVQASITEIEYIDIPASIEAENYLNMVGMQAEDCTEGGQNIGYIDVNDYLEYPINVAKAGNYELSLRVASESSGGSFNILADNQKIGTVIFQKTGGWQNWQTISVKVNFAVTGKQKLKLLATKGGWNINWLRFESITSSIGEINSNDKELTIYPNPSSGEFRIEYGSFLFADVEVFDVNGKSVLNKLQHPLSQPISLLSSPGVFVVRLKSGDNIMSAQLIIEQ